MDNNPMKVAFCSVFNKARDGISDYSGYLADEFKKYAEVTRVSLDHYIAEDNYYIQKAEEANSADIIHVQFNYLYFNGNLPYRNKFNLFLKHLKKPVVVTMHEVRIGYEPIVTNIVSGPKRWIFNNTLFFWNFWSKAYHQGIFSKINKIVVHTKNQQDMIRPLVKDQSKVIIIPHGIPVIDTEKKNYSSLEAKKALGFGDKIVLTIFGFINQKKGYELALESLKELSDNIVLLIAGGVMTDSPFEREYYDSITKRISDLGLTKRVKITGYLNQQDIPVAMAATDICLAPFESLSASGALSLCIGYNKPIIATDIDGHREINTRLSCLELFHQGDRQDFLEKIRGLLLKPDRRNQLIDSTRAYANEFSYTKIAKKTVLLYQEVIKNSFNGE